MKSIFSTLLSGAFLVAITIIILSSMGLLNTDQLLDFFAGDVDMGETKQYHFESEFMERLELIIGEVEVHDTSKTSFQRNSIFCDTAYVVTTTDATIKYEVKTTPELFYIDIEKKEYYISDKLGVTYHDANKQTNTDIEESNCIKSRHISIEDMQEAKAKAENNFNQAIKMSDRIIQAQMTFNQLKTKLLNDMVEAGFKEVVPENQLLD